MDKKKLNRLIKFYRRRLAEEEDFYNKKLTELDLSANEIINEKTPDSIAQLKKSLNTIYKTSDGLMGSPRLPLFLRRFIHKILHFVLGPYFKNQNDFNAQTVHLINECLSQLNAHKIKEAKAYDALVQFNQRIIALMDVKELNAAHKNFKMLLEMQNQIMDEINRLKETLMIAYEGVDRRLLSFMAQQLNTRQRLDTIKLDREEETAASEKIRIGLDIPDREMSELNALYLAFENRYRGSEELIKKRLMKYLPVIDSHEKILDIGCGRGEFLELIKEKGMAGYGIDLNAEMIKRCREKKLDVVEEDLFQHLIKVPEESLGAIVCTHVIEHIPHYLWKELLNLCRKALKQDGKIIIETLNPRSYYGVIEYYFKDPTHKHLVYPEYLHYLLEVTGYKDARLGYSTPVESSSLLLDINEGEQAIKDNFAKLNKFLFDSIEYFIIAKK